MLITSCLFATSHAILATPVRLEGVSAHVMTCNEAIGQRLTEGKAMRPYLRVALFAICALQALFAVAFLFQWPFAIQLWPWAAPSVLSYIFIASILAAAAISTFCCAASETYSALAGIALDYIVIFAPVGVYAFFNATRPGESALVWFGIACVFGAIFGVALFAWSRRIPLATKPPIPALVRWSFAAFILALVIVGARMILREPNILPWSLTEDLSVVFGFMFLGAGVYFAYALLYRSWANATGQLAGFLAYDLVLIVPFLQRVTTIAPQFRASLIIYIVVVIYSGLLACYYLFAQPQTRIIPMTAQC